MNKRNEDSIEGALNSATDLTNNRTTQVNHVRFEVGAREVIFDLFVVEPDSSGQPPHAERVYRFAMPVSAAREIGDLLSQEIEHSLPTSDDKMWNEVESLFGAWADRDDLGDDWLDNLRGDWDNRLADLHGTNGE